MRIGLFIRLILAVLPFTAAGCADSISDFRATSSGFAWTAEDLATSPYERGKEHYAAGRYGLAVKQFEAALGQDSRSVEALNGLAAAFDRLQRFDLAERYYLRALGVDPENAQTLNNMGFSYLMQKRYDLALTYLRNAEAMDPKNALIHGNVQQAEVGLDLGSQAFVASAVDAVDAFNSLEIEPRTTVLRTKPDAALAGPADDLPSKIKIEAVTSHGGDVWIERTSPTVQTLITRPSQELLAAMRDAKLPTRIANFRSQAAVAKLQTQPAPWQTTNLLIAETVVERDLSGSVGRDQLAGDLADSPASAPSVAVQIVQLPPLTGGGSDGLHDPILASLPQLSAAVVEGPVMSDAGVAPVAPVQVAMLPALDPASQETAEPSPAGSAKNEAPFAPPSGREMPVIEVSNGAGRLKMAFRMSVFLEEQGVSIGRLTNADNFRHQETVIYYRTEWLQKAQELAALLPANVTLEAAPNQRSDIRIRLGGDLLRFDQGLFYANRESSDPPTG